MRACLLLGVCHTHFGCLSECRMQTWIFHKGGCPTRKHPKMKILRIGEPAARLCSRQIMSHMSPPKTIGNDYSPNTHQDWIWTVAFLNIACSTPSVTETAQVVQLLVAVYLLLVVGSGCLQVAYALFILGSSWLLIVLCRDRWQ